MAKNKEEKTNVMRTLEQKKIAYTAKTYPHGEGDAIDGVSWCARARPGDTMCLTSPWRRTWT